MNERTRTLANRQQEQKSTGNVTYRNIQMLGVEVLQPGDCCGENGHNFSAQ